MDKQDTAPETLTSHSKPQAPVPESEQLKQIAWDQWKNWLGSTAVVVVVLAGLMLYRSHKTNDEAIANRMLGEARNVQALTAIRTQYPGTPAAPLALLQIAKAQFDSGDYLTANTSYSEFLSDNAKHPLAPIAEMGKIHCTEAMGQTAEAMAAFKAFGEKNPDSFLAPLAALGRARCLQQLGRLDESRAAYEDFLAAHPKTPWKGEIEDALKNIERVAHKSVVAL